MPVSSLGIVAAGLNYTFLAPGALFGCGWGADDECVGDSRGSTVEDQDGWVVGQAPGRDEKHLFVQQRGGFADRRTQSADAGDRAEGRAGPVRPGRGEHYAPRNARNR